jgi:cyclopropane fatty-acyl-phospholipid synthase-like methyltransferase
MHCVADSRWLDVGCGGGGLGLQLAQQGADVTLLDLPEVVDQLSKWLGEYSQRITVVCGDIFDYLPPEPFDGIVMLRFIETFSRDQLQRLFSRVSRFLKPDGHLVIIGYVRGISAHAALFSLNQALHQSPGQCYGLGDLRTLAERSDLHFDQVLTETSAGYVTVLLSPKLGAASGIETGGEAEGLAVDSDDVAKVY